MIIFLLLSLVGWVDCQFGLMGPKCQSIRVPMCKGMQYAMTSLPNHFNHHTQAEISLEISQFKPLIHVNCSAELQFFLCSLYTPICIPNYDRKIPACRSVCERVKSSCFPIMSQYGFQWPERMACELLPRSSSDHQLCMDPLMNGKRSVLSQDIESIMGLSKDHTEEEDALEDEVPSQEEPSQSLILSSVFCLASASVLIFTFVRHWTQHSYPERPLLFLSGCNLFISAGILVIQVQPGPDCVWTCHVGPISHMVIYYFQMASCCWWVIMAVTWFLSVKLMWASEIIERYAKLFHAICWVWPLLEVGLYVASALRQEGGFGAVSSRPFDGTPMMIMVFVIPLMFKIVFGAIFLAVGIAAGLQVKKLLPPEHIQSLQRIMLKILSFSLLFTFSNLSVIVLTLHGTINDESHLVSMWIQLALLAPGMVAFVWILNKKPVVTCLSWISERKSSTPPEEDKESIPRFPCGEFIISLLPKFEKNVTKERQDGTIESTDIFMHF